MPKTLSPSVPERDRAPRRDTLRRIVGGALAGWIAAAPLLAAPAPTRGEAPATAALAFRNEPLSPLPRSVEVNPRKAALGRRLFHDPRLSADDTISCAHCHPIERGGADGLRRSAGIGGALGALNTPTVLNSHFNFKQFWDGRAATLEAQVEGPIHDPAEMGSSWEQVIGKLSADAAYLTRFSELYGAPPNQAAIADAIAAFERTLITPDAPFDRFLRGEQGAISGDQRRGYLLFKSYGCASCHQGVGIGGNLFHKMGVVRDYFADRGEVTRIDHGRFNVTGKEAHRFQFKVPSLRNVALTAPYLHDGSADTLESAVMLMARYQLGRPIPREEVALIVAFLESLTGRLPEVSQ